VSAQLHWEDTAPGDTIGALDFPITVSRLVIAASGNRDFTAIHHNAEIARAHGAPDVYAAAFFLQGMWERLVRNYIGDAGRIAKIAGFRIRSFSCAGDTVRVTGTVREKWLDGDVGFLTMELRSHNRNGLCVGPGTITVTLPRRQPA
jgi:acyl dehydratase